MKHLIPLIKVVFFTAFIGLMTGCSNEPNEGIDKGINEHGHTHD